MSFPIHEAYLLILEISHMCHCMLFQDGNITLGYDDYYYDSNIHMPRRPASGFVAIGTDKFGLADFDNIVIDHPKEGYLSKSLHHDRRNYVQLT